MAAAYGSHGQRLSDRGPFSASLSQRASPSNPLTSPPLPSAPPRAPFLQRPAPAAPNVGSYPYRGRKPASGTASQIAKSPDLPPPPVPAACAPRRPRQSPAQSAA